MLEQLLMSLKVMVLGMGTVFVALIALIYVIELTNKVLNIAQQESRQDTNRAETDVNKSEAVNENFSGSKTNEVIQEDEEEIIAVITAAIAASLNRSTHDIVVRSVKRVPYNTPAWNRIGRNQQIAGRL